MTLISLSLSLYFILSRSEKDLTEFVNNLQVDDESPELENVPNSENNAPEAESSEEPSVEEGVVTDGCEEATKPSPIDESPPEISELEEGLTVTEDEEVTELAPPVVSEPVSEEGEISGSPLESEEKLADCKATDSSSSHIADFLPELSASEDGTEDLEAESNASSSPELFVPSTSEPEDKKSRFPEVQEGLSFEDVFGLSDFEVFGSGSETKLFSTMAVPSAYLSKLRYQSSTARVPSPASPIPDDPTTAVSDIHSIPNSALHQPQPSACEDPTVLNPALQPGSKPIAPSLLDLLLPDRSPSYHDETFTSGFSPLKPVQCQEAGFSPLKSVQCQSTDVKSALPVKEACVSHRKRLRKREGDDSGGGQEPAESYDSVVKLPNACPSGLCKEIWLSCDLYEDERAHQVQMFCCLSPTKVSLYGHYSSSAFVEGAVRPTRTEVPPKSLSVTHSVVIMSCIAMGQDGPAVPAYLVEPGALLPGHFDLLPSGG